MFPSVELKGWRVFYVTPEGKRLNMKVGERTLSARLEQLVGVGHQITRVTPLYVPKEALCASSNG